jgi:hypothetical protein
MHHDTLMNQYQLELRKVYQVGVDSLKISFLFIWLPILCLERSTDHEALHYSVISRFLFRCPSKAQMSPKHPVLKQLQLSSSITVRDQLAHLCTITGKLLFCILYCLYFWMANWKTTDSGLYGSIHSMSSHCLQWDII